MEAHGDRVTNRQLYDELTNLRVYLDAKFDEKADTTVTLDHEHRLRSLERFRYAVPSAALLGIAATVALAIVTIVH